MSVPGPRIEYSTAADGYRFAARVWNVDQPTGCVVCLHGIISHGGWYLSSCRRLAEAGLEVHFLDRRGSGLNAAGRGDVRQYETWIEDVEGYLAQLPPDLPRILQGISWGGKLAAAVVRRKRQPVHGLALVCPGLFAKRGAKPWQRAVLRVVAAAGLQGLRVTIPLREAALFAGSPTWQDYVAADPFALRRLTISAALADIELSRYAVAAPQEIDVPLLLMLAGRDRIIDNPRVRRFIESSRSPDRQIIEYPEATHTLEFEPDPSQFLDDLSRWAVAAATAAAPVARR
jgi:acylglycerol lipase